MKKERKREKANQRKKEKKKETHFSYSLCSFYIYITYNLCLFYTYMISFLVQFPQRMPIFVKTQAGKTIITLDVKPETTIRSVKRKITDEIGLPVDKQQLTFEDETLKDDDDEVLPKATLEENVKRNMLEESADGVNAWKTLRFKHEHTLKDYKIQRESTLYLIPILWKPDIPIFLRPLHEWKGNSVGKLGGYINLEEEFHFSSAWRSL